MNARAVRLFLAVTLFGFSAHAAGAAESEAPATTAKVEAAPAADASTLRTGVLPGNKKFEETFTLTDPKLRAEGGSLSKFSAKASLAYAGPTIGDLSAAEQPNPDGSVGVYSQNVKGTISGRYRLSPTTAISGGLGIGFIKPFHGWDRTDANNPFVSYEFSNRFNELQMRNAAGLTIATIPNYTQIGQVGGLTWDTGLIYGLGRTGLALSLDLNLSYWQYSRPYNPGPTKKGGDGLAEQYSFMWIPGVKYNFSSNFNMYTNAGFKQYNPRQEFNNTALWNRSVSLRLGAGYGITRDIYISPYVQVNAQQLAFDKTTMNVSGVFSVL